MKILQSFERYLETVQLSRSANTWRTYRNAVNAFVLCLNEIEDDLETLSVDQVQENWVASFAIFLKDLAPASERLYLSAISSWYEYLTAESLAEINLPKVRLLVRQRSRKPSQRLPQFPRKDIDRILYTLTIPGHAIGVPPSEQLIYLRDRALILCLADTGLRVHEACNLRRGDLDWNEGRGLLIGKGDRQAIVRFSQRSLRALRDYLSLRAEKDGNSGRPLRSLPLFSRHDRGAGKKILPISTTTARAIIQRRTKEALGSMQSSQITPHSFRHYFVTTVLRASGGNLKMAQELARHRNIAVTQRYAHLSDDELDQGYYEIFDQSDSNTDFR
jgi:site-specific recombinase XerD